MTKIMTRGILQATLVALIVAGCSTEPTSTIRIFGSTTIEPFMKKAIKEYDKAGRVQFEVTAMGSNEGIDSLIAGKCDVAMSSMELTLDQVNEAKKKGISLKPFLLGYDIIVPIVHPSNKVTNLSLAQLKDVYMGKLLRWSAVGGEDTVINVVDRVRSSGTYEVWHHNLIPDANLTDSFTVSQTNSSVLAYVAGHPNAIGYISAAYLNPDVRPLKIDGIAVTEDEFLLSNYHLKRPIYLYVNEANLNVELKSLVMFCIVDERGRKILNDSGFYTSFTFTSKGYAG
jgi:phosphate transport system substrate-binding protein